MKNPFKRFNPYRKAPVTAAKLSQQVTPLGFLKNVKSDVDTVEKDIKSLQDRLAYRYDKGVPAACVGERVFEPSDEIITLDLQYDGTTRPVNIVVPSGQGFTIPVVMAGPGVFVARSLTVTLYQRLVIDGTSPRVVWVTLPYGRTFFDVGTAGVALQATQKWSIMANASFDNLANSWNNDHEWGTNFFWNLTDADSQRRLSDDLLPDQVLCPQGWQHQADGNIYRLGSPWLFERAGIANFEIQFINDVLQLDPSAGINAINGNDDLENDGSVRNQSLRVRVELHGTRFYNERDQLLREAT